MTVLDRSKTYSLDCPFLPLSYSRKPALFVLVVSRPARGVKGGVHKLHFALCEICGPHNDWETL